MSFTTRPDLEITDCGTLHDATIASTDVIISKTLLCRPLSTGLVVNIKAGASGEYTIYYIDYKGNVSVLRGPTSYTAGALATENFPHFVRAIYVSFAPSAATGRLVIDATSYGRGTY
jgi:hypothetical protein